MERIEGMNRVEMAGYRWGRKHLHAADFVVTAAGKKWVRKATNLAAKIQTERDFYRGVACARITAEVLAERAA